MDVLINSTVRISSLCISNLQVVYFKDVIIFVNYISIKLKKTSTDDETLRKECGALATI